MQCNVNVHLMLFSVWKCHISGRQFQVRAIHCYAGKEKDGSNNWRWVLPYKDPCACTSVRIGGLNTVTPKRAFEPTYTKELLISDDVEKIREHYGLQCKGKSL